MSDKAAKSLAQAALASAAIAASAWCLVYGHPTGALWMFIFACFVAAA